MKFDLMVGNKNKMIINTKDNRNTFYNGVTKQMCKGCEVKVEIDIDTENCGGTVYTDKFSLVWNRNRFDVLELNINSWAKIDKDHNIIILDNKVINLYSFIRQFIINGI